MENLRLAEVKLLPYIHGRTHVAVVESTRVLSSPKEHLGLCQQLVEAFYICWHPAVVRRSESRIAAYKLPNIDRVRPFRVFNNY